MTETITSAATPTVLVLEPNGTTDTINATLGTGAQLLRSQIGTTQVGTMNRTGVATAQADRDPVVAITGQVPRGMRFKSYHQYLDTVGLFAPITKWSVGIEDPSTIPEVLANAFRVAARPRPGAVHVSVPSDVSRAAAVGEPLTPSIPAPGGLPPDDALDRAAILLRTARRPMLLIGVGAGEAAATAAIRRLMHQAAIPVACTFEGNGIVPRELLDRFTADECANYFRAAGYSGSF